MARAVSLRAPWLSSPEPPRAVRIQGTVDPRFRPVREAFAENFAARGEVGASFAVIWRGRVVVDLWGGEADPETGRPWEADTLSVIFSATKGLLALGLLMLADRGRIDYDRPVTHYWPEFHPNGKADITVRQLLNHRSGLCAIDQRLSLADFERPAQLHAALVGQVPLWAPDAEQGYGPISMGVYGAELFRRVAGESLGAFLRREVSGPLGADAYIGLRPDEMARAARLIPIRLRDFWTRILPSIREMSPWEVRMYRSAFTPGTAAFRALHNPRQLGVLAIDRYGTPAVQQLELPWANGMASARGLARVYAALIDPDAPLASSAAVAALHARQSWAEQDRVMAKPVGFAQGFMKEESHLFSPSPTSFGHPGAGGSLGWADPERELAFGYVMNRMSHRLRSPRCLALTEALYGCL